MSMLITLKNRGIMPPLIPQRSTTCLYSERGFRMKNYDWKSKCYEVEYNTSNFGMSRRWCYIFADTPEEAARIFNEKKDWQWVFVSLKEMGKAFDKNSDKVG